MNFFGLFVTAFPCLQSLHIVNERLSSRICILAILTDCLRIQASVDIVHLNLPHRIAIPLLGLLLYVHLLYLIRDR